MLSWSVLLCMEIEMKKGRPCWQDHIVPFGFTLWHTRTMYCNNWTWNCNKACELNWIYVNAACLGILSRALVTHTLVTVVMWRTCVSSTMIVVCCPLAERTLPFYSGRSLIPLPTRLTHTHPCSVQTLWHRVHRRPFLFPLHAPSSPYYADLWWCRCFTLLAYITVLHCYMKVLHYSVTTCLNMLHCWFTCCTSMSLLRCLLI